jgi:hypothetical protein
MTIHPKLVNVNMFTWGLLLQSAEEVQKLAEELGLVPNQSTPPPVHCGKAMRVTKRPGNRTKLDRWAAGRKGVIRLLIQPKILGLKTINCQSTTVWLLCLHLFGKYLSINF